MLAEDPPFFVEVGSTGGKTLHPNEEVMLLECVPTVCLLEMFTGHIQNGYATGRGPNSSPSELWVLKRDHPRLGGRRLGFTPQVEGDMAREYGHRM